MNESWRVTGDGSFVCRNCPRQQVYEGNWGCLGLGLKGLEKEAGLRLVYGC